MKVLSVNYPKLKADEAKLSLLVQSYNEKLSQSVLKEMKQNSIKLIDSNLIDRHKANIWV